MEILMRDLRDGPIDVEVDETPAALELTDEEFDFNNHIKGEIRLQSVGDTVVVRGDVSTTADTKCVRCLKPVKVPVSGEVNAVYENNPELLKPAVEFMGSEDEGITYFDGEHVRPNPQIREAIMVELPPLPVCSEDCKGLCPGCGADLNLEECRCEANEAREAGWKDKLKSLKLE